MALLAFEPNSGVSRLVWKFWRHVSLIAPLNGSLSNFMTELFVYYVTILSQRLNKVESSQVTTFLSNFGINFARNRLDILYL